MIKVIQVLGPTGVGKSEVAMKLAEEFDGEIISADSMQVYAGFDIGTSKLKKKDMRNIPHHLIDILSDCSQYNAARFLEMAYEITGQIFRRGKIPLVCGGTALYLSTMIRGIFPEKKGKRISRKTLEDMAESKGWPYLWKRLQRIDPEYAGKITPNDRVRIIRALDIYYNQGDTPSNIFRKTRTPFNRHEFIRIGLVLERQKLYKKINDRVERMFRSGFVDEVVELRKKYPPGCPPFQSLGYKEISLYLDGHFDRETAVALIQQHTRNFAKRQLSWFRRESDIQWFNPDDFEAISGFVGPRVSKEVSFEDMNK
jgi:tRNA dimethylallyltransferase